MCIKNLEISVREKINFTVNCVKIIQGNVYLLLKQLKQSVTPFIYVTSSNSCLQKLTFQKTMFSHFLYQNDNDQRKETVFLLHIILSPKMVIHTVNQRNGFFIWLGQYEGLKNTNMTYKLSRLAVT